MKKLITLIALLCALVLPLSALAEEAAPLEMAFGLFSMDAPSGAAVTHTPGNMFSDLRCQIEPYGMLVYANYAPAQEYESTARPKLDGCVSLMFALSGPEDYTETEVAEETLPNGVQLRWQLMQGSASHTLWFEAFTADMGYNMVITGDATAESDAIMLAMMRSFRVSTEQEQDVLQIRQAKLEDGVFLSAEHGVTIRLDEGWNAVPYADMLLPHTAFMLEKDGGRWLIQLLYTLPANAGDAKALLDWYVSSRGGTADGVVAITLENLGVEAWTLVESSGIYMQHIAFVHEGYGYYGSFMWITPDDAEARPFMEQAIQSNAPAK